MTPSVVVLGGGLSGCSAAYVLAQAGLRVSVVERAAALGGLAGSFGREGHFYPLGYHHILHRDRRHFPRFGSKLRHEPTPFHFTAGGNRSP